MSRLTVASVRSALKTPGIYSDGEGLRLRVAKSGSASWILRVQKGGRRQDIGLGSTKLVSLADARDKARTLRKAVKIEGRDIQAERTSEAAAKVSFQQAAELYHAENEASWSEVYAKQWQSSLKNYVFGQFGDKPAGKIEASDIIAVLAPIWQEIPETARRVRHRICVVLDYAHAKGWRDREAPSTMGSLKAGKGLPRQLKERTHRKAMPYKSVPSFIQRIMEKPSFGRLALELTILTATRSNEVRGAEWKEIDLEAGLWTVPSSRMKRSKAHIVPISSAAMTVLNRAAAFRRAGTEFLFPGVTGREMSNMTLLKVLRDAKEPYHVHGFRSAFTDWAADRGFPNAIVEAALAHKTPDATEAAYRRTTYLERRRELMEAWGRFCAGCNGEVVQLTPRAIQT
jgi:integrase